MKLTVTEISVHKEGDSPIFGDLVTHVKLYDEGGGTFIKLVQHGNDAKTGKPKKLSEGWDIVALEEV